MIIKLRMTFPIMGQESELNPNLSMASSESSLYHVSTCVEGTVLLQWVSLIEEAATNSNNFWSILASVRQILSKLEKCERSSAEQDHLPPFQ